MIRRFALLVMLATLSGSASGCGHDSAIAKAFRNRAVRGRYVYAGEGRTVTIPWRFNASLTLDGRGKYSMDVDVKLSGDGDRNTSYGSYAVDGDRLVLTSGRGDRDSHELQIRGDSLVADTDIGGSVLLRLAGIPKPVFVRER